MSAGVMNAEMLLGMSGQSKDRFDVGTRALNGGKQVGPHEMQRIREREVVCYCKELRERLSAARKPYAYSSADRPAGHT